jgi:hypothetical protein
MYDPGGLSIVRGPLCRGLASEALNAAKSGVLNGDCMVILLVYERCITRIKMQTPTF